MRLATTPFGVANGLGSTIVLGRSTITNNSQDGITNEHVIDTFLNNQIYANGNGNAVPAMRSLPYRRSISSGHGCMVEDCAGLRHHARAVHLPLIATAAGIECHWLALRRRRKVAAFAVGACGGRSCAGFSDAGVKILAGRMCVRRPRSAKARIAGGDCR